MNLREIKLETDLSEIARWFENHKWPFPAIANIGPGFGLIAEKEGVSYACVWVYITGRSLAYIDWLATNPSVDRQEASAALEALIEKIKEIGKVSDPEIKALCLYTKNKGLAQKMSGLKFRKEEGFTKLLWTSR